MQSTTFKSFTCYLQINQLFKCYTTAKFQLTPITNARRCRPFTSKEYISVVKLTLNAREIWRDQNYKLKRRHHNVIVITDLVSLCMCVYLCCDIVYPVSLNLITYSDKFSHGCYYNAYIVLITCMVGGGGGGGKLYLEWHLETN